MADLKPIGSEKLTGQDKLKRIMEIARWNESTPNNINETSSNEYQRTLADGETYGIVKERQGYIIKKTISESETDYIEPIKNRKYFSSYSQALKRLNLLAKEINRLNENEEGIELFGEQKKFVLRTPKPEVPAEEAPAPPAEPPAVPSPELPPSPVGDDMPPAGEEPIAPEGEQPVAPEAEMPVDADTEDQGEADDEMVTFKTIQKLTGKLTQKIRALDNQDGMTSEDIKYVINMVLSALDLKNLSEEDKEDIMGKFEEAEGREEGEEEMPGDEMGDEDITSDTEVEKVQTDLDAPVEQSEESGLGAIMDGIFGESKVDKVISKYFEISKKEILERQEKKRVKIQEQKESIRKVMNRVIEMCETKEQGLASQKFLEENLNSNFIGKTNKNNLVFENKGKQIKISPEGLLV